MNPSVTEFPVSFAARVEVAPSGCWIWRGLRSSEGYGRVQWQGRVWVASRLAWFLATGEEPGERFVCHSCDNPPCVNPEHLFLGTVLDNYRDSRAKGRTAILRYPERYRDKAGEKNGRARLTVAQVREIRQRYAAGGISQQALADEFGLHQTQVSRIIRRQEWGEA